jgi:hypothetical protein
MVAFKGQLRPQCLRIRSHSPALQSSPPSNGKLRKVKNERWEAKKGHFREDFSGKKQKRIPFLTNEPEKLLTIKDWRTKTNPNEPKNKAGKLLKTRTCGKNKPKNKAGHVIENKGYLENKPETPASIQGLPPIASPLPQRRLFGGNS